MNNSFGERLKQRRLELGYSQADLSNVIGLQAAAISKYEKNAASPNVENLRELCLALRVSANYLLGLPESDFGVVSDPIVERVLSLSDSQRDRLQGYLDAIV